MAALTCRSVVLFASLTALGCEQPHQAQSAPATPAASAGSNDPAQRVAAAAPAASVSAAAGEPEPVPEDPREHAKLLAKRFIIVDGHVDVPYRLEMSLLPDGGLADDISQRTERGDFDWTRAREGGLDAPFMSIYTPARLEGKGAKAHAEKLIDMVDGFIARWPDKFAYARTPADVGANFRAGKMSLPMGMENGSPIERKLENVAYFHQRGIRYITLAHSQPNHLSDSSYSPSRPNGGLSKFGKQVVTEMNRLGLIVDISHLSDAAIEDVFEVTKAPVLATHSSARHFTPGFERNLSDELLLKLKANGGAVLINFGSGFLDDEVRKERDRFWVKLGAEAKKHGVTHGTPAWKRLSEKLQAENPGPFSTVERVADHIDHVVKLIGIDHVGLGSDFEGVGDSLPTGLKDVSMYPNLIAVLLERGYSPEDIEKIVGGNALSVWDRVEAYARSQDARTP